MCSQGRSVLLAPRGPQDSGVKRGLVAQTQVCSSLSCQEWVSPGHGAGLNASTGPVQSSLEGLWRRKPLCRQEVKGPRATHCVPPAACVSPVVWTQHPGCTSDT